MSNFVGFFLGEIDFRVSAPRYRMLPTETDLNSPPLPTTSIPDMGSSAPSECYFNFFWFFLLGLSCNFNTSLLDCSLLILVFIYVLGEFVNVIELLN